MNTETARIKKLLQRSWEGPMWYGGCLQQQLQGISWEKAFHKPGSFTHNIYEYVMHMYCWRHFTLENLLGNHAYKVELNSEADWVTQYEASETTWLKALEDLADTQEKLLAALDNVNDSLLEEVVPGKNFKWYALLHGVIHHDIYHSGQIGLLKK